MKAILLAVTIAAVVATGVAFGGQNTGGDKRKATSELNPQPLPPGRHPLYRRTRGHKHRKHRRSTAYQPQWGGFRRNTSGNANRPK